MINRAIKEKIIERYVKGEKSMRALAKEYGTSANTISKWMKTIRPSTPHTPKKKEEVKEPDSSYLSSSDVGVLQEELRKLQLRNKLLNAMLDIGKEQYGIDLRKKPGTKQS